MCVIQHTCILRARYWNEKCLASIFDEMLNVSADILALAAVSLVWAEEVSSIFYGNKTLRMECQVFLVGYFHPFPQMQNNVLLFLLQKHIRFISGIYGIQQHIRFISGIYGIPPFPSHGFLLLLRFTHGVSDR